MGIKMGIKTFYRLWNKKPNQDMGKHFVIVRNGSKKIRKQPNTIGGSGEWKA